MGSLRLTMGGIYKRIGLRSETPRRRQLSETLPGLTITWAQRLNRVFRVDIETCRHCGGAVLQIHRESGHSRCYRYIGKADIQLAVFRGAECPKLADCVEKLGAKNLREFFQSTPARRVRCFGLLSHAKQFEVPLRANIFVIRKHRLEASSFSTESAASRRSGDEIHPWPPNGGLRPRLCEKSGVRLPVGKEPAKILLFEA